MNRRNDDDSVQGPEKLGRTPETPLPVDRDPVLSSPRRVPLEGSTGAWMDAPEHSGDYPVAPLVNADDRIGKGPLNPKFGLAGFLRAAPNWQRVVVGALTLPAWLASEVQQSSLNGRRRRLAVASIGIVVVALATLTTYLSRGDQPTLTPIAAPPALVAPATPAPQPSATPTPAPAILRLVDKDCTDFESQEDAQAFFREAGGPENDMHGLDSNRNGRACDEPLPTTPPPPVTPAPSPIVTPSPSPTP